MRDNETFSPRGYPDQPKLMNFMHHFWPQNTPNSRGSGLRLKQYLHLMIEKLFLCLQALNVSWELEAAKGAGSATLTLTYSMSQMVSVDIQSNIYCQFLYQVSIIHLLQNSKGSGLGLFGDDVPWNLNAQTNPLFSHQECTKTLKHFFFITWLKTSEVWPRLVSVSGNGMFSDAHSLETQLKKKQLYSIFILYNT